jgi:cobalt-zinc-cadmium resistance protein CzcA
MIARVIETSIRWRVLVVCLAAALMGAGIYAAIDLPIDAVPDVTTNQVQINTLAPAFTAQEMEQYVTAPLEVALTSLPYKEEIRSISQFGLSQITVVFDDALDVYRARQLVLERLIEAQRDLPPGVSPELAPVSTGLGEIYQFAVADTSADHHHSLRELRTTLDWFIKPQLRTVPGVIEVNSFGGEEQQYEVLVDPARLSAYDLSVHQVVEALARNNANIGGAYLEEGGEQQLIRGVGLLGSERDIANVVVTALHGTPVFIRSIGTVRIGSQIRQGAATQDGRGETVIGMAMLLKGDNSRVVAQRVASRLAQLQPAMPAGMRIEPFYDRSQLVDRTIHTAVKNLIEGGVVVMAILFLFLLQVRAGLIVSSAIPLAMTCAILGMRYFGISANLMSLGAIDFGLIVDAAVIIVENAVRRLAEGRRVHGRRLTGDERRTIISRATTEVLRASVAGQVIILAAYLPIVSLVGIEGKMFRPMAWTVVLALVGALVLSLTVIPALAALVLREPQADLVSSGTAETIVDRGDVDDNPMVRRLQHMYRPLLGWTLARPYRTATLALALVLVCGGIFPFLGAEFLPKLDEGALAINVVRLPSVSLTEAVRMTTDLERVLVQFPEVEKVVSRIGRPEIATDPMGPNMGDTYVFLKPRDQWRTAHTREGLIAAIESKLHEVPTQAYSFSQPIEFRMQELIEGIGARSDVVIKIFGDDLSTLKQAADDTARAIRTIAGADDVKVQEVTGLPMLQIVIDREAIARHGINVADVEELIQTAVAGTEATRVLQGTRRFELVVRLRPEIRERAADFGRLLVAAPNGQRVPLAQLARISTEEGPLEISREDGQRRISVEVNVRGRDIAGFVHDAQRAVREQVSLPAGYVLTWGGLWQHLESGRARLMIMVPVTFLLIFFLLFVTFRSVGQAALVFTGIPFAVTGGVLALLVRGMHFSMSAGIGFIAVSGVAVLNGVVLVAFINALRQSGREVGAAVRGGALARLRPVLMTASVASLGFLPMALSTSAGAEVQQPLATVVIGGLVTSTALTLLVLPTLYLRGFGRPIPSSHQGG